VSKSETDYSFLFVVRRFKTTVERVKSVAREYKLGFYNASGYKRFTPRDLEVFESIFAETIDENEEFARLLETINPRKPCPAMPGTLMKQAYLRARYVAGLPLFHKRDARSQREVINYSAIEKDDL
jgi:hypothetical protein